eukprot:2417524-Lingulodinium_polyedra.AAC.1
MALNDRGLRQRAVWAEGQCEITTEGVQLPDMLMRRGSALGKSLAPYCPLTHTTDGPAFASVANQNTTDPACGLRAWKALQKRFGRT